MHVPDGLSVDNTRSAQVKDELPIINAYDDAWPVAFIVRAHRHKKKMGSVGLLNWEDKAVS